MIIPISGDTFGLIACKDDLVPVAELAKVNIVFISKQGKTTDAKELIFGVKQESGAAKACGHYLNPKRLH